jgi:hypothetical protein
MDGKMVRGTIDTEVSDGLCLFLSGSNTPPLCGVIGLPYE